MNKTIVLLIFTLLFSPLSLAQEAEEPNRIIFTNVNVFDGVNDGLQMNTSVLVEDNLIAAVGSSITLPEGAEVIDGGGIGTVYWEPGWITSNLNDQWGTGSSWENNAFFDYDGNLNEAINYMTEKYK